MPMRSLTQLCQWHCGAWFSSINANEESDSAVSMILRSLTPKYGVRPRGLSIMYSYEHWKLRLVISTNLKMFWLKNIASKWVWIVKKSETNFLFVKLLSWYWRKLQKTYLIPLTPLSLTPRCQRHHGVRISSINDTVENFAYTIIYLKNLNHIQKYVVAWISPDGLESWKKYKKILYSNTVLLKCSII